MTKMIHSVLSLSAILIFSLELFATETVETAECLDGGKLSLLSPTHKSQIRINSDRSAVAIDNFYADSFEVIDLQTGKKSKFRKPLESKVHFLKDGKIAYSELTDVTIQPGLDHLNFQKSRSTVIDPKTGESRVVLGQFVDGDSLYSALPGDGKNYFTGRNDNGQFRRMQTRQGYDTRVRFSEISTDPDVTWKINEFEITSGKQILFHGTLPTTSKNDGAFISQMGSFFSPDRSKFFAQLEHRTTVENYDNALVVIDLVKKSQEVIKLPRGYRVADYNSLRQGMGKLSSDSRRLILNSLNSKGVKIVELKTGKFTSFPDFIAHTPYFDSAGNICGIIWHDKTFDSSLSCIHSITGEPVSQVQLPFNTLQHKMLSDHRSVIYSDSSVFLFSTRKICPKVITPVSCDCTVSRPTDLSKKIEGIKNITLAMSCGKDFSIEDWKNLPSGELKNIDESSSLILLKRFSKPGGFDPEKHTGHLLGMLKVGLHKSYPAEFKGAFAGVLHASDLLYESILKKFPEIRDLPEKADQSCQTTSEKQIIAQAVSEYVKGRVASKHRPTYRDMSNYTNIARDTLSDAAKESLAEFLTYQLVETTGDSEQFHQIFSSKVYKFANQKMKDALGLKYNDLTDVTVTRNGNTLLFFQLGLKPFSGSNETVAGFHIKTLKTVSVLDLPMNKSTQQFSWTYSGQEYSADIGIDKSQIREIVKEAKAPNYTEMWREKEFRGVIVAGTNLGPGLTDQVMRQYIEYYAQQGFTFDAPKLSDDLPGFLKDSVSGIKPMHYFVKEAHSDGDEKNLFRISKKGKILRGRRQVGDKKEVVDLIYPTSDEKTTLVSNQDFGEWIKAREKNGRPELVYLNSSCWSKTKAVFELSAAASSKLVNIPTTTFMSTFVNHESNVMHAAIDGLRNQKSYQDIRSAMEKNPEYKSNTGNVFIFPDQSEYKTQIIDVLKIPVDVSPKLFVKKADGVKKPYSIEDTH